MLHLRLQNLIFGDRIEASGEFHWHVTPIYECQMAILAFLSLSAKLSPLPFFIFISVGLRVLGFFSFSFEPNVQGTAAQTVFPLHVWPDFVG